MKEKPLVSVAIITNNQKELLKECIESVLSQDYPNIEIVVADDDSSDNTVKTLSEQLSSNIPLFSYEILNQENLGAAKARETAINIVIANIL